MLNRKKDFKIALRGGKERELPKKGCKYTY